MASDDMKKMLMLVESCSCESNKAELEEVSLAPPDVAEEVVSDSVEEELDFDAFLESIREITGAQLDELSPKKYTDTGNARVAQARELDNIELRGTGHAPHRPGDRFDARDFPKDTPQGKLAMKADKLLKYGKAKELDAEKKSIVSPATARAIGLEEQQQQAQEDAEFQSFMETLKYVMKR